MSAPTYESSSAIAVTSTTTLTIDKPSGVTAGDLLIANVRVTDLPSASVTGVPDDWELVNSRVANLLIDETPVPYVRQYVYFKQATGSEPDDYSWELSGSTTNHAAGAITRITGHDPADPINAVADGVGTLSPMTVPVVTTTVDDCLLLHLAALRTVAVTLTPASGYDEKYDMRVFLATATQATAGASAAASATMSDTSVHVTMQIAIAPPVPIDASGDAAATAQVSASAQVVHAAAAEVEAEARLVIGPPVHNLTMRAEAETQAHFANEWIYGGPVVPGEVQIQIEQPHTADAAIEHPYTVTMEVLKPFSVTLEIDTT